MTFWRNLNILAYILGIFGGIIILIGSIIKYKKYKFKPFLLMGISLFFVGIQFGIDLFARFQGPDVYDLVYICLRLTVIIFYPSSLLAIFSFFLVQAKIPWFRMIIYALFFGMMIEIHLSSDYFVIYNPEYKMWFTDFINIDWMNTLNLLTSLPFIDLIIYVIMRHYLGFVSNSAKFSVFLFWIGLILPNIFLIIPISNMFIDIAISNIAFVLGLNCYSIAFIKEPLVFTLSKTKYYEIIIASPEEGDIAIGQYAWVENETKDLKSQALSAINSLLNEMLRERSEDINFIQMIDLGKKKVIIERSNHYIAYMIASADDPTIHFGLKLVLRSLEKHSKIKHRQKNVVADFAEFKSILKNSFKFATAANKIQ